MSSATGPAASGGQTVLANDRNGGRLRLIASRHDADDDHDDAYIHFSLKILLQLPMALIQIYFEGAKFFPQGGGRSPNAGGIRGEEPPPHQLGVWSAVSSPSGSGAEPLKIWCNLRPQNSLQKYLKCITERLKH